MPRVWRATQPDPVRRLTRGRARRARQTPRADRAAPGSWAQRGDQCPGESWPRLRPLSRGPAPGAPGGAERSSPARSLCSGRGRRCPFKCPQSGPTGAPGGKRSAIGYGASLSLAAGRNGTSRLSRLIGAAGCPSRARVPEWAKQRSLETVPGNPACCRGRAAVHEEKEERAPFAVAAWARAAPRRPRSGEC